MIIQQCLQAGLPLPQAIQKAPILEDGLQFYIVAYNDVASGRLYEGGEPMPLSWYAIQQWCFYYGCDEEETEDVHHHVTSLDAVQLEHMRRKTSKKTIGAKDDRPKQVQPANAKARAAHRRQRK